MFREPNQIVPFLRECATEGTHLMDEYRPIKIDHYFMMASYRIDALKFERKAKQILIRPGRFKNNYVNIIIASKSEDEKLIHYWTCLAELASALYSQNILLPLDEHHEELGVR
jgi:hypothetical protein